MSLAMTVTFPNATKEEVRRIAETAKRGGARIAQFRSWPSRSFAGEIEILSAHDALADDADWGAETWRMRLECLVDIAVSMEQIYFAAERPMVVTALWAGESPACERTVSIEQMLEIIRSGTIGTRTAYTIHGKQRG